MIRPTAKLTKPTKASSSTASTSLLLTIASVWPGRA